MSGKPMFMAWPTIQLNSSFQEFIDIDIISLYIECPASDPDHHSP